MKRRLGGTHLSLLGFQKRCRDHVRVFRQKDRRLGFLVELNCSALYILDLKPGSFRNRRPPSVGPEFWLDASGVIGAGGLVAKDARAAVEIGHKRPNPQALDGIRR